MALTLSIKPCPRSLVVLGLGLVEGIACRFRLFSFPLMALALRSESLSWPLDRVGEILDREEQMGMGARGSLLMNSATLLVLINSAYVGI